MDFFRYFRRFRRRTRARYTTPRSRRFTRRISLELLEERTVLSANVLTVNSTADFDSDPTKTTLREAINSANATINLTEPDQIMFNLPADDPGHVYFHNDGLSGQVSISQIMVTAASDDALLSDPDPDWPYSWFTIRLMATPPTITEAVVIDGYTQFGAIANTLAIGSDAVLRIELDGSSAGSNASGLQITGDGNAIRGLAINRFRGSVAQNSGFGIYLDLGDNNVVAGNFVGTDVSGTIDLGNATEGVYLRGSTNNRIGGTVPAARNVLSGNNNNGINFFLSSASNNVVQGNYIGINAAGTAALGNSNNGVAITGGVSTVTIGGTVPGAGNVISGNGNDGIDMAGFGGSHLIQGNIIGADPTGSIDLGNLRSGVHVEQPNNTIGGTTPAARNVISGNNEHGVLLNTSAATGNVVTGNFIGTNVAGSSALGNIGAGVAVFAGATGNTIGGATSGSGNVLSGNGQGVLIRQSPANQLLGNLIGVQADGTSPLGNALFGVQITDASSNLIGGIASGAGNTIAHNGADGVYVAVAGTGNAILGNRIYSNTGLGIDLDPNNVTPNDAGDADTGANNRQNFPVLISVQTTGTSTTIDGTLNSTPSTMFRVELFASPIADPTGFGEGQTFLGAFDVTTNTSGDAAFAPTLPVSVAGGQFVTATATVLTGGSSNPGFGETSEFARAVEVSLVLQEFDFGDAPNWFPTLLAQDGARHVIDPAFHLLSVDAEDDGQPGLGADADDAAGSDDEDGVTLGALLTGYPAEATVIASAVGVLNAWIDFNVDGDWTDPGEHIFIDQAVHAGRNNQRFAVPAGTVTPGTYARFRYSSASGLSYTGLAPDGEVEDYLVPIVEPSTVSGLKFSDLNGDRDRDINEPGLDGWVIYADLDDNGLRGANEPTALTHHGGIYTISGIPPGTYKIREELQSNWVQTFPEAGYYELDFTPGSALLGATFGNRPLMDFGDANGYPTLLFQAGAAHIIDPDFYLGFNVDDETDGQLAGNASGDDAGGIDDEDGVLFNQQLLAGNQAPVIVIASAAGLLDAWLDFNGDFDWDDADEQVFDSRELNGGFNALQIHVPDWITSRQTFARFRLSSAGGLSPRGLADDGEVEDYLVTILRHEDFGDAPPEYASTLLAENGARHLIIDGFHLGDDLTATDHETDGQPSAAADGDDNAGDDDETGVFFPNPMRPGLPLGVFITTSAGGRLDAWVDFNADGDWADFGEQVFTSESLFPGGNFRTIQVPIGAALSDVFARFRLSSAGGLSYDGPAPDGEVEDYAVPIDAAGTIAGRVWHDRDADGQQATDEPGLPNWGIFIDDDHDGQLDSNERLTATDAGGNYTFDVPPGNYDVAQLVEPGWQQAYPLSIPRWVYVAQQVWRPSDLFNPGYLVANRVQIFDQATLELIDTFGHDELDEGRVYDIEIGPGSDVYVAVDLDQGHGQIVQFTYEGDYVRTIDLPDDGQVFHRYPDGFDVLPDGSLLIAQPDNERIVRLNPDSSVDVMLDVPGIHPRDAAVLSDGTIVFTTDDPDADPRDTLLNVRSDDLVWVGTSEGAQLRKWGGGVIRTRGDLPVREALETSEGILFTTEAPAIFPTSEHRLVKYDVDGNELDHVVFVSGVVYEGNPPILPVETEAIALGLAVALSEVPFGEPVRDGVGELAGAQASLDVHLMQSEIPVAPSPSHVATGLGTWRVRVEAGQVSSGADFGIVELSTASGLMFEDRDGDRIRDTNELGLDGWVVYADLDDDGVHDGREPSATTAGGGLFTIEGILPGTHKIREVLQPAWRQTAPAVGYHEVNFLAGSAIAGLDFGNQPCPANWLVRTGDTLRILGDTRDNQVLVSAARTGLLTVIGESDCFYEFTGIRRIIADMRAGDDQLSLFAPVAGNTAPIDLDLRMDQDDDQLTIVNWLGNLMVDLGAGDDRANIRNSGGGGSPDPGEMQLDLAAGLGDDAVEVTSDNFFDIFIDLGAGDDMTALTFVGGGSPDPSGLHLNLAAGAGDDEVNLTADSFFDVFVDLDLGAGDDMASVEIAEDKLNIPGQVRELRLTVDAGAGDDVTQSCIPMSFFNVLLDFDLGDGDDRAEFEHPIATGGLPAAESRSLRTSVMADSGADVVQILIGLVPPVPTDLATLAPTEVPALSGFFDVFFDLDLGAGDDLALFDLLPGSLDVAGKVRELHLTIDAGAGDDLVQDCEPMTLPSEVFLDIDLGAGDDELLIDQHREPTGLPAGENGSLTANVIAGSGDDLVQILIGLLPPQFSNLVLLVDLGAGNDTADLRYVGGGAPDPAGKVRELRVNVLGGLGDDTINAVASAFFEVEVQANLGAGDDRFALALNPDPLPLEDLTSIVHVIIDAGSGTDGVVLDVERISLAEVLESILVMGVGLLSIEALFPLGALSMAQAVRDDRAATGPSTVALKLAGSDVAIDIVTGPSDDLIKLELDPDADGSVRFSAATGDGDDSVQLTASSFFDVFVDLNLGAGNDKANVKQTSGLPTTANNPGPQNTEVKIVAGAGNDEVNLQVDAFFDVFVDLDLGRGNDTANLRYVGGGTPDPSGRVRELRVKMLGGLGNDTLRADVNAPLADLVFMHFDGGQGNDLIRVDYRESPTTGLPPQKLHIHVLGGDGNDDLALLVATSRPKRLLHLLLDGGKGRDRGSATPNVKVKNREIVVPVPAPVAPLSVRPATAASRAVSSRGKWGNTNGTGRTGPYY